MGAGTRENFSRRFRRLRKFFGRGGILPLHFYFSPTALTDFTDFYLSREREFSHADLADCTNFLGGAASCRSIFTFLPPISQTSQIFIFRGNAWIFLTQISQIAQIFWEERHLAAPFLLFFLTNSKRRKRDRTREREFGKISRVLREKRVPAKKAPTAKRFFGRSGILPLHFCYFFSQTPSAESATELAQGASPG